MSKFMEVYQDPVLEAYCDIEGMEPTMEGFIATLFEKIKGFISKCIKAIVSLIKKVISKIRSLFKTVIAKIASWLGSDSAKEAYEPTLEEAGQTIQVLKIDDIMKCGPEMAKAAKMFDGVITDLYNWGDNNDPGGFFNHKISKSTIEKHLPMFKNEYIGALHVSDSGIVKPPTSNAIAQAIFQFAVKHNETVDLNKSYIQSFRKRMGDISEMVNGMDDVVEKLNKKEQLIRSKRLVNNEVAGELTDDPKKAKLYQENALYNNRVLASMLNVVQSLVIGYQKLLYGEIAKVTSYMSNH